VSTKDHNFYLNLFTQRLIELRKFHGITALELAREIGRLKHTSISNLEAKHNPPSFKMICDLAHAFQVSPAIFFLTKRDIEILAQAEVEEEKC
jgi:transcriptional regulator with XRE-family HTH domain